MIDMIFIEDLDEAFRPLVELAKAKFGATWENFVEQHMHMYMYSDKSHSFFKHVDTRKYLKLPR